MTKPQHKQIKKQRKHQAKSGLPLAFPTSSPAQIPITRHFQVMFDEEFYKTGKQILPEMNHDHCAAVRSFLTPVPADKQPEVSFPETPQLKAESVNSLDLVKNCSILIGMHPDEATEPIVQAALLHNKPFAVLPCCVFHHLFPHRRTPSGAEVKSTSEFIEYLVSLDPVRIKTARLGFVGSNVVVYRL